MYVDNVASQLAHSRLLRIDQENAYQCVSLLVDLDLKTVCDELGTLKYKKFEIGVQLGIAYHKLKEFEKELDPLAAAIDYWLKGNAKEGLPCSWQSIVAALRSPAVDEAGLAGKIEEKYCSNCPTKREQRLIDIQSYIHAFVFYFVGFLDALDDSKAKSSNNNADSINGDGGHSEVADPSVISSYTISSGKILLSHKLPQKFRQGYQIVLLMTINSDPVVNTQSLRQQLHLKEMNQITPLLIPIQQYSFIITLCFLGLQLTVQNWVCTFLTLNLKREKTPTICNSLKRKQKTFSYILAPLFGN